MNKNRDEIFVDLLINEYNVLFVYIDNYIDDEDDSRSMRFKVMRYKYADFIFLIGEFINFPDRSPTLTAINSKSNKKYNKYINRMIKYMANNRSDIDILINYIIL